jgi:CRISPR system Cascade subunit CasD
MASWGEVAVGELRPSDLHPTRSALLGLLGAALGLRRSDRAALAGLGESVRCAVRIDSAGVPLADYHTAQVAAPERKRPAHTRADQLRARRGDLQTILSRRDYRCDALYTIAVRPAGSAPRWPLAALRDALERPVFPLYLGRKSCPPALPLAPRLLEAATLQDAFAQAGPPEILRRHLRLLPPEQAALFWDGEESGMNDGARRSVRRRDDPDPRRPRAFRVRWEHSAPPAPRPLNEEDLDVPEPDSIVS